MSIEIGVKRVDEFSSLGTRQPFASRQLDKRKSDIVTPPIFGEASVKADAFLERLVEGAEARLPARDGVTGQIIETYTGIYQFLDAMRPSVGSTFEDRARATGTFVVKTTITTTGVALTAKAAVFGGALGGVPGLFGGVAAGLGVTALLTTAADSAWNGALNFLKEVIPGR